MGRCGRDWENLMKLDGNRNDKYIYKRIEKYRESHGT